MATAIDNLGRKIDSSNMTLGEIKSLIGTLMKSKVGAARPIESKKEGSNSLVDIKNLLEKHTKDFSKEVLEQKKLLSDVVDNLKDIIQKRVSIKAEAKDKPKKEKPLVSKEEKAMSKSSDGLYKTFAKKGSGYTHDIYVEKVLKELCRCLKKTNGPNAPNTPSPPNPPKPPSSPSPSDDVPDREKTIKGIPTSAELALMNYVLIKINYELSKLENKILGFNVLGELFQGVIEKERKIVQEMRMISYETAGATKESMSLMRSFEEIGSSTIQTGVDRDKFQAEYVKKLKHGIKDLKVASNITKTQLNTERQLGLEAGSLGEEFISWNKAGRMSVGQLAEMGRGMRDVARYTGMTGDELAQVVKSSKEFMDSLRNAGTLTAAASKNIIEIGANAKKLGIEQQMQPLLKGLSSTTGLLLEASDQTKALLFNAAGSVGRISDLMNGTILRSKSGIKDMAQGINNVLKNFGVESMEAIDQLSDDAKFSLNMSLKASFGVELGELRSQYEALNEAGKGMAERLSDINKKRSQNLTLEEKASLMEEERRLKTNKSLEVLTALDESAKGAKDMNQALATFGKRRGEFEGDLKALGTAWTSETDVARSAITNAMDSVNDGLKKAGKQEIKIDSSEIEKALKDPAAMRELTGKIVKGEQELSTAQKSQLDPLTSMEQSLTEINDNIRNYTNKGFSMAFNSLIGKIVIMAAAVAGVVATLALIGVNIVSAFDQAKRSYREIESYFKGKVAAKKLASEGSKAAAKTLASEGGEAATKALTSGGVDKLAQEALKSRLKANKAEREAMKNVTKVKTPTKIPTGAFEKGFARAEMAGEGFFKSLKRGMLGLSKEKIAATRNNLRAIGGSIESTSKKWSKMMKKNGEILAQQIEKNPMEAYQKMIANSWKGTTNTVIDIGSKIKNGFERAKDFTKSGMSNITKNIKKGWSAARAAAEPGIIGKIKGARSAVKGASVAKVLASGTRGVTDGLSAITKASGKASSSLIRVVTTMNPLGLALVGAFAAVDGLTGAFEASERAAETFGKKREDVTLSEEYAAKTAGLLTGILNGLTFGIAGLILPMDSITDSIARFNAKIPILTIALAPLVIALELAWGAIKGVALAIWDVMKGLWNGIMNVINPIVEGLSDIFSSVAGMFVGTSKEAGGLTKAFREMGGIVGIVSGTIRFIGTSIGWIFQAVGAVVGFILKATLKIIEGLLYVLQPIGEVFAALWQGAMEAGRGIGDVFMGIWDAVISTGSAIYSVFSSILSPLMGLFGGVKGESIGFMDVMKGLGKIVGTIAGILVKFVIQPLMMVASLLSGFGKIIQAIMKVFRGDFSGAGKLVGEAMMGVVDAILWPFKEILSVLGAVGTAIFNAVHGIFSFVVRIFSSIATTIFAVIGTAFGWIGSAASGLFGLVTGVLGTVFSLIGSAVNGLFGLIGGTLGTAFSLVGGAVISVVGVIQTTFGTMFGWIEGAASIVGAVFGGIASSVGTVFSWIGSAFDMLSNVISTVARSIYSFIVNLEPVVEVFSALWEGIQEIGKGFYEIYAIFEEIVSGIFETVSLVFGEIFNVIGSIFGGGEIKNATSQVEAAVSKVQPAIMTIAQIMGYATQVISVFAKVATFILKVLLSPLMIFAKVLSGVGKVIQAVAKMIRGDFSGAGKLVGEAIRGIVDAILWPFKEILGYFAGFRKMVWGSITSSFSAIGNFGSWLFNGTINGMIGFGSWLYNNTIGAMIGFGSWLYNNTIGAMVGFGSWLYENTIGAIVNLGTDIYNNIITGMGGFGSWLYENTIGAMNPFSWFGDKKNKETEKTASSVNPNKALEKSVSKEGSLVKDNKLPSSNKFWGRHIGEPVPGLEEPGVDNSSLSKGRIYDDSAMSLKSMTAPVSDEGTLQKALAKTDALQKEKGIIAPASSEGPLQKSLTDGIQKEQKSVNYNLINNLNAKRIASEGMNPSVGTSASPSDISNLSSPSRGQLLSQPQKTNDSGF